MTGGIVPAEVGRYGRAVLGLVDNVIPSYESAVPVCPPSRRVFWGGFELCFDGSVILVNVVQVSVVICWYFWFFFASLSKIRCGFLLLRLWLKISWVKFWRRYLPKYTYLQSQGSFFFKFKRYIGYIGVGMSKK